MEPSLANGEDSPVTRLMRLALATGLWCCNLDCRWLIVVDLAATVGLRRWLIVYVRWLGNAAFVWHVALDGSIAGVSQCWFRNRNVRHFRSRKRREIRRIRLLMFHSLIFRCLRQNHTSKNEKFRKRVFRFATFAPRLLFPCSRRLLWVRATQKASSQAHSPISPALVRQ